MLRLASVCLKKVIKPAVLDCKTHLKDGHIKGATTQVKHQDGLVALLLKPIGQRCSCGLVDDPQHVQATDLASVLCCLPLGVIEVGRDGNDGLVDLQG